MKSQKLRTIIPLAILAIISVAYIANVPVGSLSAIGWGSVSLLCPLGALTAMIAARTLIPRALIALVIVVILIILLGRAFCGWVCPVPVVSRLRNAFSRKDKVAQREHEEQLKETVGADAAASPAPLTAAELKGLKACSRGCGSCASKGSLDSRHLVLGGALLSTAIFGFPVFCLVCPIGLTFATVFLVIGLFGAADVTWSVVFVPVLLLVEVVFFRKWCSHICPVSALMSLISKGNRTFVPTVDESKCLESKGATCGVCSKVCDQKIDPRHPELGSNFSECTKCRKCVEACPGKAITMPLLPKKGTKTVTLDPQATSPARAMVAEDAPTAGE